jgi:hypothetical protein
MPRICVATGLTFLLAAAASAQETYAIKVSPSPTLASPSRATRRRPPTTS